MRTYSSGMRLRLAFGISTAVRPDIAIFDEVIGVGDIQFHAKAKQRLDRLIQDAKIVFICSHDMTLIAENCTRALWLEGGRLSAMALPQKLSTPTGTALGAVVATTAGVVA